MKFAAFSLKTLYLGSSGFADRGLNIVAKFESLRLFLRVPATGLGGFDTTPGSVPLQLHCFHYQQESLTETRQLLDGNVDTWRGRCAGGEGRTVVVRGRGSRLVR